MPEDGRLLVVEHVVEGGPEGIPAKMLDLEMLVMTSGGRERTRTEFEALFERAGLKLTGVTPTPSGVAVIEGRPGR
jgi:hypothetical protein